MVNTCGFIDNAKEESIDSILEMVSYKEDSDKKVVVTGCLGQRYPEQLSAEIPEVDAIIGLSEYERMTDILGDLVKDQAPQAPRVEVQASRPSRIPRRDRDCA